MTFIDEDIEYFTAEHAHAIAVARAKVADWDLEMPHALLECLRFLEDVVEAEAERRRAA